MKYDKKKLLIVSPLINPIPAVNGGAVESLLTNFIKENEKQNRFSLFVISIKNKSAEEQSFNNCKVYYIEIDRNKFSIKDKFLFSLYMLKKIFRKLIFNRITKVLFKLDENNFQATTYAGFLSYLIYKKVKPDYFMSEGNDKLYQFSKICKKINPSNCFYHLHFCRDECLRDRFLFNNSICVSEFVKKCWVINGAIDGRNSVIYNGIDLNRFSFGAKKNQITSKRDELGINKNDFVVCFAARFRPGKGILNLLNAFKIIKDKHIKLLLMGDFVDYKNGEEQFKKIVRQEIRQNPSIVYVGKIEYENIHEYYAISDAQVICSTYKEASPLVAIEGMARGLPLIVTKTGGLCECLTSKCSIQLEIDDNLPINLANSIVLLSKNRDLCIDMGNEGFGISKQFSKERYYEKICNFILNNQK